MAFFDEDSSQINQSYLFKDRLDPVFYLRVGLTMLSGLVWWCQIYEYSEVQFYRIAINFEYLTFWGVWSVHLYFLTSVVDMIFYLRSKRSDHQLQQQQQYVSKIWKLQHFLFHFAFSTSLAIVIMFWVADYPELSEELTSNKWYMFNQIIQHGLLFVCISIEFIYNDIRFAWKHLGLVSIALTVYLIVNVSVTLAYEPVYEVINWVSLMSYVYVVIVYLLVLLYFYFAKYIYHHYKLPRIQSKLSLQQTTLYSSKIYPKI